MKTYKIYTAGKMGGLSYDQQVGWRREIEDLTKKATNKSVVFVHPPMFYQYTENDPQNDIESMNWDMNQLIDSDIVLVDLSTISDSVGTHMELGLIAAVNRIANKTIWAIGIGTPDTDHPWIRLSLHHIEPSIQEAANYISEYLLI